jgi:tetratricopeptide (TPR) repeat protein
MDTATAKALLQSTDLVVLHEQADRLAGVVIDDDPALEQQYLKLQILLWTRVLALQRQQQQQQQQQPDSETDPLGSYPLGSYGNVGTTLTKTGAVWLRLGDPSRAIGQLKKALEVQDSGGPVVTTTVPTYQLLGQAYMVLSDYTAAAEHHARAIRELEDSIQQQQQSQQQSQQPNNNNSTDESPVSSQSNTKNKNSLQFDLVLAHCQLASVYEASSEFSDALDWLQKADEACADCRSEDERDQAVAVVQAQLGTLNEKLGDYTEAMIALSRAHEALVRTLGEDHTRTKEIRYLIDMASSCM